MSSLLEARAKADLHRPVFHTTTSREPLRRLPPSFASSSRNPCSEVPGRASARPWQTAHARQTVATGCDGKEEVGSRAPRPVQDKTAVIVRLARAHDGSPPAAPSAPWPAPTHKCAKRAIRATECILRCLPWPRKRVDLQGAWSPPGAKRWPCRGLRTVSASLHGGTPGSPVYPLLAGGSDARTVTEPPERVVMCLSDRPW
jgi:hypothetical protein